MIRCPLATVGALAALLLPLSAHAQAAPTFATPGDAPPPGVARPRPAAPPTLADSLALAEVPKQDVYLAVGAENTRLPMTEGTVELPPPGSPIAQVADTFGRLVHGFETVTAIAPPTMTLLNTAPGTPNPFDGIPKDDAFKLLLGSLNDAQWAALTSDQGLGATDLAGNTQRDLFTALFPTKSVTLHADHQWDSNTGAEDSPLTLTETDMAQVRLRVRQRVMIGLPVVGKKTEWLDSPDEAPKGQTTYQLYGGEEPSGKDTLYGVQIRDTVPNASKTGDLDFNVLPAFKKPVGLDGVKTVGDLVARVGQATRTELYADRRYEKRSVTLLGPRSGRARDILEALALCVTGTFRRVGPAFVLTDDVVGAGTRRSILGRFAQEADLARHGAVADSADRYISAHGGVDGLPMGTTRLGFSDAEMQKTSDGSMSQSPGQGKQFEAPLAQLTPAQQQAARRFTDAWNNSHPATPNAPEGGAERVTLDRDLLLMCQPTVQMMTPVVPGPVSLESYIQAYDLFRPSQKLEEEWRRKQQAQQEKAAPKTAKAPPPAEAKPAPAPSLAAVLAPVPERVVIAHPKTATEVDALVASMKAVGLNRLWLDVFSGGRSHLDPPKGDKTNAPDILTEALAQTKGTDILVVPTVDLLDWGKDAPDEAVDHTMLGETSAEAATRRTHYERVMYSGFSDGDVAQIPAVTNLNVSPASATVHQTLLALVARLAATRGVRALALQNTATTGYDIAPDSHYGVQGDALGYTPTLRLAFLRAQHADPIDLEPENMDGRMSADTSLPEFDDYRATADTSAKWGAFRSGADRDLMDRLLAAARTAGGPRFPLWVHARRTAYNADWYGQWEDPRGALPELSEEKAFGGSDSDTDYAALARAQCRMDVLVLNSWETRSAAGLTQAVKAMKPGWSGFVLDRADSPGDPLADLARSLSPVKP